MWQKGDKGIITVQPNQKKLHLDGGKFLHNFFLVIDITTNNLHPLYRGEKCEYYCTPQQKLRNYMVESSQPASSFL